MGNGAEWVTQWKYPSSSEDGRWKKKYMKHCTTCRTMKNRANEFDIEGKTSTCLECSRKSKLTEYLCSNKGCNVVVGLDGTMCYNCVVALPIGARIEVNHRYTPESDVLVCTPGKWFPAFYRGKHKTGSRVACYVS